MSIRPIHSSTCCDAAWIIGKCCARLLAGALVIAAVYFANRYSLAKLA